MKRCFTMLARRRVCMDILALVLLAVGTASAREMPAPRSADVTLQPDHGTVGTRVTATGTGWPAGTAVYAAFFGREYQQVTVPETVDTNGNFTLNFCVPNLPPTEGQFEIHTVAFFVRGKGHDGYQYNGMQGYIFRITRGSPGNCQIANGADVNAKGQPGATPLYVAAGNGHVDVVKLLIDKGADVDAKDKNGQTPLYWAAEGGHMDVAKLLIAKGADVDAKSQRGDTPLYVAAMRGRVAVAELLIAKGADVNTKVQAEVVAGTPLHEAAYHGNVDLAKLLIAKGAEVNAKDQEGYTPLDIAAQNGHKDIVELLRQHLYKGKPTKPQGMIKKDKDLGAIEGTTGQEPKADRVESSKNNEALPAASADTPPIKTGDTYIIESLYPDNPKLNSTTERKVISVGDGKITVASRNIKSKTGSTRTIRFTPEWNLISSRNPDGSGLDYSPPLKYFEFPLYPGKTWRQTSIEKNSKTGAVREHTLSATAGDWEDVSVSAGTFRAIKITTQTELLDRATRQRSTGTDISWYAPNIRRSVKSEVTSQNFQGNQERQLIQMIRYDLK